VETDYPEPVPDEAVPEDIPLDIVYEDDDLLVVNKPKGMVVHPAAGNYTGTLVNALLFHCKEGLSGINGVIRPGIVHRIDRDTSGILIVAKHDEAHVKLADQIKEHSFDRIYHTVVVGNLKDDEGTIEGNIGRHPKDRLKMAIVKDGGKPAVTHYKVLKRFEKQGKNPAFNYVEVKLETGRTHQIRVHMSSIGHPVAGDTVYGGGNSEFEKRYSELFSGQCLHAKY
jgi:23S rRNA pseudouridine1911/1915/1917 synthase